MIAAGAIRPVLVGVQVVVTFGVANVAGAFAASNYQTQQVQSARSAVSSATAAFDAQVQASLDDGTLAAVLDPIVAQEHSLVSQPIPSAKFFVDQHQLDALHQRVDAVDTLISQVQAAETQVEAQLHQQLVDALAALTADIKPAQAVGVDTAPYQAFADTTSQSNQQLNTPKATQAVIDGVKAKDQALKDVTAQKVSALQELAAAQDDAKSAVASAQSNLAKAQAIPVLNVAEAAKAIAALAATLAKASTLADFQAVASDGWTLSNSLNRLLTERQSAYDLLNETRHEVGLAQGAGKDVSADATQLEAAAKQLDAAGDLATILAVKAQIQAIKNDIDAKYWQAIYGSGKVIVISILKEELMALQNGVVVLDSPVTTGRPSMPTVTGVFHIIVKHSPYCMSSWQGNPYPWAGCAQMQWAMEFEGSGYYIHDAPWRSYYGPGTNTEANGTHGCVNVPHDQMGQLYPWTDVGTTVVVLKGDFGSTP